mmetsp:Transcript_22352/g.56096  ORF Transcript_22352/g.56096 Transcript_22352/m.56096 type:complete len:214 (+) Transcript_22352:1303-1944(+)
MYTCESNGSVSVYKRSARLFSHQRTNTTQISDVDPVLVHVGEHVHNGEIVIRTQQFGHKGWNQHIFKMSGRSGNLCVVFRKLVSTPLSECIRTERDTIHANKLGTEFLTKNSAIACILGGENVSRAGRWHDSSKVQYIIVFILTTMTLNITRTMDLHSTVNPTAKLVWDNQVWFQIDLLGCLSHEFVQHRIRSMHCNAAVCRAIAKGVRLVYW